MLAYVGLELATGIIGYNVLEDYWSSKTFLGHRSFTSVMGRDRFKTIRAAITLIAHDPDPEIKLAAPLWSARNFMDHFVGNCATIAVPLGAMSLDENTAATKGRSVAVCYLPSKPDKYGLRFYAVVGHTYSYLYSLWDNGSGNAFSKPLYRYCSVFPALRRPVTKVLRELPAPGIAVHKPTALWVAQTVHPSKVLPQKAVENVGQKRYLFCDNFYTRHNFAYALLVATDYETVTIGTVHSNYVHRAFKSNVQKVMEELEKMRGERGHW